LQESFSGKSKPAEITPKAVVLGILLSVILAAANAYLGLFAAFAASCNPSGSAAPAGLQDKEHG